MHKKLAYLFFLFFCQVYKSYNVFHKRADYTSELISLPRPRVKIFDTIISLSTDLQLIPKEARI